MCYLFGALLEWIIVCEDEKLSFCQLTSASFGLEVTYSFSVLKDFTGCVSYRRTVVDIGLCSYLHESPLLMNSGTEQTCLCTGFVFALLYTQCSFKGCGAVKSFKCK